MYSVIGPHEQFNWLDAHSWPLPAVVLMIPCPVVLPYGSHSSCTCFPSSATIARSAAWLYFRLAGRVTPCVNPALLSLFSPLVLALHVLMELD